MYEVSHKGFLFLYESIGDISIFEPLNINRIRNTLDGPYEVETVITRNIERKDIRFYVRF